MSGLIKTLCSAVESKGSGSKVKVQDSSVGVSVQSYLQGPSKNVPVQSRKKVLDSAECLKLTCSLFSMPRTKRREFLSRVSDSVRRQLIFEGKHIRKLITDSCIAYDPELCWAIENTVNGSDDTAEEILEERLNRNRLPEDVKKWYESYQKDPYGDATRRLEKLLKPFKLTRINKVKDDTNIEEYLDEGKKQESEIQGALQEEVSGAAALSEEAQAQLDEIKEGVADRTKSFIESLVEEVTEVVPTVASQNAIDRASERTEEIINKDSEKGEEKVDGVDAEADEVFNDEYAEYDDKVSDSLEEPKVGSIIVVSGNTSSPKLGERGKVEKVLEKGNVSARFKDGSLHVYSKNEYKVLDSVESAVSEGDEVVVTSGRYKDKSGKVERINPELDAAFVTFEDGDHFIVRVSELVKKVQDCEGEPAPVNSPEQVQVMVTGGVTTITTGTGISVMVDNKKFDGVVASTDGQSLSIHGLPKEFYEAAKIEPVEEYQVPQESVKFEETTTEPAPETEETVEESMTDEVWDSLEALYPEAAKIADSVELDGVEKVVEDFQVGSTVDFQNDTWKVTKAGKESITLKKTSTGEEKVVNKDCFSDVYVVQPARCIQDSEESDAVKRIVYNWLKKYSSELATNAESTPRRDAFEELAADLNVIDEKFEYSDSIECEVDYDGDLFMKDDASTLLVGGTSFIYQATDSGVEAIAEQASTAASELYDSYEPEVEETFETEETLMDALDAIRSGLPVNVVRVQDDEGKFIIMMTDLFGRDRKFVTEDGETTNKDEAKRFSDKREAFNFMKSLSDAGKLTHSIFNSAPLQVTDDDNDVLSDEAKEEVLKKVEEEVVERLKEKGVDVSDRIQDDGNAISMVNKAIEEAEKETETDLTPEQKESGDYKKGHVTIQDFDIAIENPKGSVRSGVDKDGNEWSQEMHNTYGYFEGTKGKDSDDVDCFLGPNPLSEDVFVNWDADKLMEYYDKVRKRKVSKEDYPSLKVKDDEELGEEKYAEFEQKLLEALKALGIDPEEGEDPQLPVPKAEVKEGKDNTYDAPHNSTTFRNLRDTEAALSKVLEIASKLAGKDKVLSVEEYKKILEDSPEDPILPVIADSTFTVGELDLICPDLYKRKFTDKFWVADSIESLGDSFNIEIPEQFKEKSALVSTSPINTKGFVVDSILEYPYSESHKLYVAPLKERL